MVAGAVTDLKELKMPHLVEVLSNSWTSSPPLFFSSLYRNGSEP